MAPFPLIKLGTLALKQISKPVVNYIKRRAKASPVFRTYICIPPAQFYHWIEVNFRLRLMGLGGVKNVDKLSEKEATELGGEMLGEFLVFFSACLILLAEYQRGAKKDQLKEERLKQEKMMMNAKLKELSLITEVQESQIRDLQIRVDALNSKAISETTTTENQGIVKSIFRSSKIKAS